ncbi:MAG: phosphoribosylanthranilate isomerase [Chitinophagaceae bacterium]|nr:MAG: phosphoribosylanthranilate isomerase [Chitinophagaceae bacterium]
MEVKVCGITTFEELAALPALAVRYAGFIFYPPSPRQAQRFGLRSEEVRRFREPLYKIGVFVNSDYETIMRTVEEWGLDMVQLHGHETPYECERLLPNIDVIKAFRFIENDHVQWTIKDYFSCTDFLLLDTGIPLPLAEREQAQARGGTPRRFNWNRLRGLDITKPFFLSGGIEPGDAAYVRSFQQEPAAQHLAAVDLCSRFERVPGIKDLELVRTFIDALRNNNAT